MPLTSKTQTLSFFLQMHMCELCSVLVAGAAQVDETQSLSYRHHDVLEERTVWLLGAGQHSRTPGCRELGNFSRKEPNEN